MIEKLVIYPTFRCNLFCKYCHYRKDDLKILSYNNFKKAFKTFLRLSRNPQVIFLGGETLIYKERFFKFIGYIKKIRKDIPVVLFTNATLIDKKTADIIKTHNIKLVVSLDGKKETTDSKRQFRNKKISVFDRVMRNLKVNNLIDASSINMVVNKKDIKNLSENIDYLYKVGFRSIGWNIDYSDKWSMKDIKTIKKEVNRLFINYLKLIKEKKEIYEISNRYEIISNIIKKKKIDCSNLILFPDGNFYPCDKLASASEKEMFTIKKNIIKQRSKFFNKMKKKKITSNQLFCKVGVYLFYKYVEKLSEKEIRAKLKIISSIQQEIFKITTRYFKILIRYNIFREKHKLYAR